MEQLEDNLETFGEPFTEKTDEEEEAISFCERECSESPAVYLCIEAEITSYAAEKTNPCLWNFMGLYLCTTDERGKKYGLSENRIKMASPDTEFLVDCVKQQDNGKEAYFINIEPGEIVPVRCLYVIPKKNLEEDLYMELYYEKKYDTKLKCEVSSNSPDIKFLKLPQIEEVY